MFIALHSYYFIHDAQINFTCLYCPYNVKITKNHNTASKTCTQHTRYFFKPFKAFTWGSARPSKSLRSASKKLLIVASTKLKAYSWRSFSFAAPKLWKSLLEPARHHDAIKTYSLCRFLHKVLKQCVWYKYLLLLYTDFSLVFLHIYVFWSLNVNFLNIISIYIIIPCKAPWISIWRFIK